MTKEAALLYCTNCKTKQGRGQTFDGKRCCIRPKLIKFKEEFTVDNKIKGVGTQSHYENQGIQPIDYIVKNKMNFLEGNVIKYVTRYKDKNGLEDLQKAQQYLTWLIDEVERKSEHFGQTIKCRTNETLNECMERIRNDLV